MVATLVDEVRSESRQANISHAVLQKKLLKVEKKSNQNWRKPANVKKEYL
jgi:hypothetical protein